MKRGRQEVAVVHPPPPCYFHEHAVEDVQQTIRALLDVASQCMLGMTCQRERTVWRARVPRKSRKRWPMVTLAAWSGHLRLVTWAMWQYRTPRRTLVEDVLRPAAEHGHVPLLAHFCVEREHCVLNVDNVQDLATDAAAGGSIAVLQWLLAHFPTAFKDRIGGDVYCAAAAYGQLAVLQWLYALVPAVPNRSPSDMFCAALRGEHWPVVAWCHATLPPTDIGDNPDIYALLLGSSFSVPGLQWLLDHRVPVPPGLVTSYLHNVRYRKPPEHTLLEHLQWMHTRMPQLTYTVDTMLAAAPLSLAVVKWLRNEVHCPWAPMVVDQACHAQDLAMVQWLLEQGCPVNPVSLINVAVTHNYPTLTYLVKERHVDQGMTQGGKQQCLQYAANRRRWDVVQWLYEHWVAAASPPPLRATLLAMAYAHRNRNACTWLLAHDCPMPAEEAVDSDHEEVVEDDYEKEEDEEEESGESCLSDSEFDSVDRE